MCEFQYSRAAALGIGGATVATAAIVGLTPMPWTVRAWVLAALALCACEAIRRVAMHRGPRGVRAMRLSRGGELEVRCADDRRVAGAVRDGSFVAPWLTIVLWRPEGARIGRALVILPDMVRSEEFRRLRVLLRWG